MRLSLVDPTDYRHGMVYGMAWMAWQGIWYDLAGMALYMVLPGRNGIVYGMAWSAWHGTWYGLGGHSVVPGITWVDNL